MCMCENIDEEEKAHNIEIEELANNKYRCSWNGRTINIYAPNYQTAVDRASEEFFPKGYLDSANT